MWCPDCNKFVSEDDAERGRLNIVNNLLDKGRLLVDPSCAHLIKDFEQVVTNEQGFIPAKADDPLTHISDATGYVCVATELKAPAGARPIYYLTT